MPKLVIFDWKRTLYDPDTKKLIKGAVSLLKLLKAKSIPVVLVGKGKKDMANEVKKLQVGNFLKKIVFVDTEKNVEVYKQFIPLNKKREVFFVGDRVRSELEVGKKLGARTVWLKQGKFANELPQNKFQKPDFTISSLKECLYLFKNFK